METKIEKSTNIKVEINKKPYFKDGVHTGFDELNQSIIIRHFQDSEIAVTYVMKKVCEIIIDTMATNALWSNEMVSATNEIQNGILNFRGAQLILKMHG